jgi:exo-beta-1,3-glucanase (GH17 family)
MLNLQVRLFCTLLTLECGWPAAGDTLGAAVPSEQNQYIAVSSIIASTQGSVIVFEAFNDYWKAPGPQGVENSFVRPSSFLC